MVNNFHHKTLNFSLFWAISDGSKIQIFQGVRPWHPWGGGLTAPQTRSCLSRRLLRFLCVDFIECHPCLLILAGAGWRTKKLPRQSNGVAWHIENHSHLTSGAWDMDSTLVFENPKWRKHLPKYLSVVAWRKKNIRIGSSCGAIIYGWGGGKAVKVA